MSDDKLMAYFNFDYDDNNSNNCLNCYHYSIPYFVLSVSPLHTLHIHSANSGPGPCSSFASLPSYRSLIC